MLNSEYWKYLTYKPNLSLNYFMTYCIVDASGPPEGCFRRSAKTVRDGRTKWGYCPILTSLYESTITLEETTRTEMKPSSIE